jgi:competence protein ComEA
MASRGATATEPEFDAVVSYLVKFFGTVNVNKADSKEIQEAAGFSPEQADGIVSYRGRNGDFKSLQDLQKVPGLDATMLEEKRDRIAFQ